MAGYSSRADTGDMTLPAVGAPWIDAIDVSEHHCIDFDTVAGQDVGIVIVRAGRGTRQDARWVEHVRAVRRSGLHVGSYWHLYPSHTDPHHQAELWMAAIQGAASPFSCGHWADIATSDEFGIESLGRYVTAFLGRMDALIGEPVGVFTSQRFWRDRVALPLTTRPLWSAEPADRSAHWGSDAERLSGVRTLAADRGGPGSHRVHWAVPKSATAVPADRPHFVTLLTDDAPAHWRQHWIRCPDVAALQVRFNELGADLVVDGILGPATEAAVQTCELLRRRDRLRSVTPSIVRPPP